ncbi:MAG: YeeE/YedE family protein [Myxococcales bacterium]|nr:YeeE/YedE family protein [Myxococcales bacterium]
MPVAIAALAGGALIGLSASALLALIGQVAGVSGILGAVLAPAAGGPSGSAQGGAARWRIAFLGGLVAGGALLLAFRPSLVMVAAEDPGVPPLLVAAAGLLVGFGTQLGSGCTSGHGVCGVSRGSARSIAATITFMVTAALVVFFVRHVLGGALAGAGPALKGPS